MKALLINKELFGEEYLEEVWLVSNEFDSSLLPQLWKDNRKKNESEKFYQFMEKMGFALLEWDEITL